MGNNLSVFPCLNRDPQEKAIIEKENSMMINKFTVVQLKDVFFYQNFGETITYANVMKAIRRLTESSCEDCAALYKTDDTPAQKNFKAILKPIIDGQPAEKFEENKFKFKELMIILIILSKNNSKDKIQGILQLEGKEKFKPDEVKTTLTLIFKTVIDCSLQLIIHDMEEKRKQTEIRKFELYQKNIDTVVKDSVEKVFTGGTDSTPLELGIKFYSLMALMSYDVGTCSGIRKALKDHTKPEEIKAIENEEKPEEPKKEGEPPKEGEAPKGGEPPKKEVEATTEVKKDEPKGAEEHKQA